MTTIQIVILLLILAALWGGFGYRRVAPAAPWVGGWSPLGIVLVIVLVLLLTGRLH